MGVFHKKDEQKQQRLQAERNRHLYSDTLRNIRDVLQYEKGLSARIAFLDFAIRVIGCELETEMTARIFQITGEVPEETFQIPFVAERDACKRVDLSDFNVLSRPYDRNKLIRAVSSVFLHGFVQSEDHYNGILYPELKLVLVLNGRHHLAAAHSSRGGSADLVVCPLDGLFDFMTTDGAFWYYPDKPPEQVDEYRMAVLYTLAKERHELAKDLAFEEPAHSLPTVEEPSPYSVGELLKEKNDEIFYLRQENALLRAHLEQYEASAT